MPNPTQTFSGTVDGIWLMPFVAGVFDSNAQAWIGARTPDRDRGRSVEIFEIPTRAEKVSQAGALHLAEGVISGLLMERHGLSGDEWLTRLTNLIDNQYRYDVYLVSPRTTFKVELNALSDQSTYASGQSWWVQVPFREIR